MRIGYFPLLIFTAASLGNAQQQPTLAPSGSGGGYYMPIMQQLTGVPCGHYGAPACKAEVTIPPGASAETLFQMGSRSLESRQASVAAAYFEASANLGYVRAQAAIGFDYVNGAGEPKDLQKGIHWLTLAAQQGSRGAESQLGQFYEEGTGVPKDQVKAIAFYKASAEQHFFQAERALGLDYEFGNGVAHSRAMAMDLLRRAANDGNDATSAKLFNALNHAPASSHFANLDQLIAFMAPPPPRIPDGCRAAQDFALPSMSGLFCRRNPGCVYHVRALNSEYTLDPGWWYRCDSSASGNSTQIR